MMHVGLSDTVTEGLEAEDADSDEGADCEDDFDGATSPSPGVCRAASLPPASPSRVRKAH